VKNPNLYERRTEHFLKSLENLKVALFLLTDDRRLQQNVLQSQAIEISASGRIRTVQVGRSSRIARPSRTQYLDSAVLQATKSAVEWVKEQVLSGSKQGEADANTIYAEIVRRLASISGPSKVERTNLRMLTATLQEQAIRSREFAKFGFPAALNISDLVKSLSRVRKEVPTIFKIVEPFVDTTKAKLDALQEVQDSVSGFVATLNSFFKDKKVEFNLNTGITITANDGTTLPAFNLSSGEKQLLLLFCNTLITKDEETICLIDEPEISLNIKWQRHLIRSLLESTRKRKVQFVLATHSFELFAPYKRNVVELVDPHYANARNSTTTNFGKSCSRFEILKPISTTLSWRVSVTRHLSSGF
jgi:ABC-type phosphate/phosphonate transport system ATPase subunit